MKHSFAVFHMKFLIHAVAFQDAVKLNPATDFYKKLALDCAADQVSVDVFLLSSQYSDIASLSK